MEVLLGFTKDRVGVAGNSFEVAGSILRHSSQRTHGSGEESLKHWQRLRSIVSDDCTARARIALEQLLHARRPRCLERRNALAPHATDVRAVRQQ